MQPSALAGAAAAARRALTEPNLQWLLLRTTPFCVLAYNTLAYNTKVHINECTGPSGEAARAYVIR